MQSEQQEKLKDYLRGLKELSSAVFPIGAVVYEGSEADVLEMIKEDASIVLMDGHPELILQQVADSLEGGKLTAMHVSKDLSQVILDQLRNLAHGRMLVHLPGSDDPRQVIPHMDSGLILLAEKVVFENASWWDIPASVCRLF